MEPQHIEKMKRKCFREAIDNVGTNRWFEYIRKLGLSEGDLRDAWEGTAEVLEKKWQLLQLWSEQMGTFDSRQELVLEGVRKELYGPRNASVDSYFKEKLEKNRDKAWLLYRFIEFYSNESYWLSSIARDKMIIPENRIEQIKRDFSNNSVERKYQCVLYWCGEKSLGTLQKIVAEFRSIGVRVPNEFEFLAQRQQVESSPMQHDVTDGPAVEEQQATVTVSAETGDIMHTPIPVQTSQKQFNIMLSYCHKHHEIPRRIAKRFKEQHSNRFNVWIDVDDICGKMYDSMAEAVETCDIFLMFMSQAYQQSDNCRSEAVAAKGSKKLIIPINVESGFKPTKWLRLVMEDLKYFDLTKVPFEEGVSDILKEIDLRTKAK